MGFLVNVGNFLKNNKNEIIGGLGKHISGGNGAGSQVGAVVGSVVGGGPIGGTIGKIIGKMGDGLFGKYFSSFKQGGFRCLGKQAFHQGDLNQAYQLLQQRIDSSPQTPQGLEDLVNYLSREIPVAQLSIDAFRSKCSKQNKRAYQETVQNTLNSIDKSIFTVERRHGLEHWTHGKPFFYDHYTLIKAPTHEVSVSVNPLGLNETLEGKKIDSSSEDNHLTGSLVNAEGDFLDGIDPSLYTAGYTAPEKLIEEVNLVGKNNPGTPSWTVGAGGTTRDGVNWSLGAHKDNQDKTMQYILLGLAGLLAYKVFFDKK